MDEVLRRALAAAARAFADELDRDLSTGANAKGGPTGTGVAMYDVLRSIGRINDELQRGADDEEVRAIALHAGMDPRGLAGYYSAGLLEKRDDGRWLRAEGRLRLGRLAALRGVMVLDPDGRVREVGG